MMVQLFPEGFEEREETDGVELAAYTDWRGEERLWQVFGAAQTSPVADDWAERWRTFHRPVRVGPLWVGPPWLEPDQDAISVVVEPGHAFGTGAHPTTRLCLEILLGLERGSLLDIGCGSGVLAIGAAKLGFSPVVAVDSDPAAVEATEANAAANGVAVDARLVDALDPAADLPAAGVGVANIAHEVIARLSPRLQCDLLVASGYLEGDQPAPQGFRLVRRHGAEGWAADLFARE
jgi:ribosomal protein L11 methyltransferase